MMPTTRGSNKRKTQSKTAKRKNGDATKAATDKRVNFD